MKNDDETVVFRKSASVSVTPEQLVGTVLAGRYQIEKLLGLGGMGNVYLGKHLNIGRRDAIKVLHDNMAREPTMIARFRRGARNVGAIQHPNVCTIYDFSTTDDGLQYLAMEFVTGESLKELVEREGPLPLPRAMRIVVQIASALQAAHDIGVVHRDLKPANVMVTTTQDGDSIKVVDFDISKGSAREEHTPEVTQLGFSIGTPEYMSPEQYSDSNLDGRSDVYSLAVLTYSVLTGKLPFEGESTLAMMSAKLVEAPARLNELLPGRNFPTGVQQALDKALTVKPEERTPSARQFAEELRTAVGRFEDLAPTVALPTPQKLPAPTPAATGSRKMMMIGATAGTLAIAGIATALLLPKDKPDAPISGTRTSADSVKPITDTSHLAAVPNANPSLPVINRPDATQKRTPQTTVPGSTTSLPAPPPVRNNPVPAPSEKPGSPTGLTADRGRSLVKAYQLRLLEPPRPDADAMRVMRDSVKLVFELPALSDRDRGLAALVAASLSHKLNDTPACFTWATRAHDLVPDNQGASTFLDLCKPQL